MTATHWSDLSQALTHCATRVPLYRGLAVPEAGADVEAACRRALERFPILTKERLRGAFPHQLVPEGIVLAEALKKHEVAFVGTSGTTGERVQVLWHQPWWDAQERDGFRLHSLTRSLVQEPAYREAVLTTPVCSGNLCHVGKLSMDARTEGDSLLFLNQTIDPSLWTDEDVNRIADELEEFEPTALEGDPAYLAFFAVRLARLGRQPYRPRFIDLSYEFPSRRHVATIRRIFGVPVLDAYGSTECGFVFMECDAGRLHHNSPWTHVEIVPVRGATGFGVLVVTPLRNAWLNLVRFDTGDLVRASTGPCPCGQETGLVLEGIEGRVKDCLFAGERVVTVREVDRALANVPGLLHWKLVQKGPKELEIDLVPDGFEQLDASLVAKPLEAIFGARPAARVVASVPVEASGKFRLCRAAHQDAEKLLKGRAMIDTGALRAEFPLLARELAGKPIAYLDCASTTPKPRAVLEAIRAYYESYTANVHRGVHPLAAEASAAFEEARHAASAHLGASPAEVVFTRGTTEGLNLIAASLGLGPEDEVLLTLAEHHSNMLPWRARAKAVFLPSRQDGLPRWEELEAHVTPRTKLIACHHASNVLGTIAPVEAIAKVARARGVPFLLDGAQAAGHLPLDVRTLGCDFYAFSSHKLGGPTGTGVLYARSPWLEKLEPYHWGGGMVARVDELTLELKSVPHRFEAGTPNVEGVLGTGAALGFLREIGMENVRAHGEDLARTLLDGCSRVPGVRVLGADAPRAPRIPLVALELPVEGLDAETLARTLADTSGLIVSAGQHCTHPLHAHVKTSATLRASAWVFNTHDDIERFVTGLRSLVA